MSKYKIIAVVGATASGKTSLGVALAKKFNGELVSADSRQIYRGLDIGSGKEGDKGDNFKSIGGTTQWLTDVCNPQERFTLFDYLPLAKKISSEIIARGKLPILVGGTGLYIKAFAEGYEQKKSVTSHNLKYSRDELEALSLGQLQKIAKEASVNLNESDRINKRRIIGGVLRSQSGLESAKTKPGYDTLLIAIDMDREELYGRIDRRVEDRFKVGMLEEVEGLINSGVDPKWLLTLGLEYRYITQFILDRNKSPERKKELFKQMKQILKYKIHGYARRQLIWWRREPVCWVKDEQEAEKEIKKFLAS